MTDSHLHVRFPSTSFISLAEFEDHRRDQHDRLEARDRYERGLAGQAEGIRRDGTCAPCLRRASFTSLTTGGEAVPDWRAHLVCDCEDRLDSRARALLHFLEAEAGLRKWSRVLLFGPAGAADPRIAAAAGSVARLARLGFGRAMTGTGGYRLDAATGTFHLAVCSDYLHRVPPLDAALAELRRVLVPGGRCVLTMPFRDGAAHTVTRLDGLPLVAGRLPTEAGGEVHAIGWDILDRLRKAGFADARAHRYWSDELGYLGACNMIVSAAA
jgi:SAM-dependent methyltransferase